MDGALLAIGSLVDVLSKTDPYRGQLEHMLIQFVLPEFGNPRGHLRAKACWVAGAYAGIQFQDPASFSRLLGCVVDRLGDPELPVQPRSLRSPPRCTGLHGTRRLTHCWLQVRVDAIVALRAFAEEAEDLSLIRPILPQLLNECFKLMAEVDNEDLVFTLETLVEKFGEEIAPFALGLTLNLVNAFSKCMQAGEAGDDDASGALASLGCLRAISTILDAVSDMPKEQSLYPQLEDLLWPLMQRMISTDGQDVFEEVLEIVAYLTYYSPTISDRMWGLWPQLLAALDDWAIDYFDNILVPLDNFISRGTERYLAGTAPNYQADMFAAVQRILMNPEVDDGDCKCAAQLIECVLLNCRGRVDGWVEPFLRVAGHRLERCEDAFLKDLLLGVYSHALYYNAPLALAAMARLGALGPVFSEWVKLLSMRTKGGDRSHFRREHDKKVVALGLAALLPLRQEQLPPELVPGMPLLFRELLALLGDLKQQREARIKREAESEDEEVEDDDEEEPFQESDDDEEAGGRSAKAGLTLPGPGAAAGGDDDGSAGEGSDDYSFGDDYEDDDEVSSPLDEVDAWIFFADAVQAMGAADPGRAATLQTGLDFKGQALVMGLLQFADARRRELAQEAAAAKKDGAP